MSTRPIAVVGPTGTGKSALALDVAERVGGEIVNADAMQLYRGMDIGTAKPTAAERAAEIFKAAHVVALPAVQRNGNRRENF